MALKLRAVWSVATLLIGLSQPVLDARLKCHNRALQGCAKVMIHFLAPISLCTQGPAVGKYREHLAGAAKVNLAGSGWADRAMARLMTRG